jgi:hypothetical protein
MEGEEIQIQVVELVVEPSKDWPAELMVIQDFIRVQITPATAIQ